MQARRSPLGSRVLALLAALVATFALLVVAGCGGSGDEASSSDAAPDPATLAPAGAAVYGEVTVRPSGDMKDDVVAAARKVLRVQDPGAELRRLLDQDSGPGEVLFSRDIEPWLGERVGGFFLMPAKPSDDADGALVFAVRDRDALEDAIPRLRRDGQRRAGTYRGVEYDKDIEESDTYAAPVGDFYVLGTLRGLRAAIDVSKDGDGIAETARFEDATGDVPADALAFFYVDPRALAETLESAPNVPRAAERTLARLADSAPVTGHITATADEIAFEATADDQLFGEAVETDSEAEVSVGQLPGDSWLALATPPLGRTIRQALDGAGLLEMASAQVRAELGFDLDRDLLRPLGALGLFARGTNPLDIGGGALLQMTDAAAAERLLTRIQAIVGAATGSPTRSVELAGARGFEVQIPQSPQPIVVLAKGDRIAAGYAASSARDLLDPAQRFDESSGGKAAIATLGDGYTPSVVVLVSPLADLLGALDELEVADLSKVLPYVRPYRSLAIGTKHDGDRATTRVVAALR